MKTNLDKIVLCFSIFLVTACGDNNIAKVKNYPLNDLFTYGQSIDSADYCKKVRWSSEKDDYGRWKVTANCSFSISPQIIKEDIEKVRNLAETEEQFYYKKLDSNISAYETAINFYPNYFSKKKILEEDFNALDPYSDDADRAREELRELESSERSIQYLLSDFFTNKFFYINSPEDITTITKRLENTVSSKYEIGKFIDQERSKYIKSLDKFKKDIPGEKEHTFLITNNGDVKLENTRIFIDNKEIEIRWDFGVVVMTDLHKPNSGYFLKEASRFILPKKFSISVDCEENGNCVGNLD